MRFLLSSLHSRGLLGFLVPTAWVGLGLFALFMGLSFFKHDQAENRRMASQSSEKSGASAAQVASAARVPSAAKVAPASRKAFPSVQASPLDHWNDLSLIDFIDLESGKPVSIFKSEARAPVTAVLVWASWCEYCKLLIQRLIQRRADRESKGPESKGPESKGPESHVKLVLINVDDSRDAGIQGRRQFSLKADWIAPRFTTQAWITSLELPVLRVFDEQGLMRCRFSGFTEERMQQIEACLIHLEQKVHMEQKDLKNSPQERGA